MEKVLSYGAVLWDIIKDKKYLGGAPLNLAAHLKKLGCDAYMYTALGADDYGREALEKIKEIGIRDNFIQTDCEHPTGYTKVILDEHKSAQYEFCENASDKFIRVSQAACEQINQEHFRVLCYGTYCQKGETSRASLKEIVKNCRFDLIFCDINIRDRECDQEMLLDSLSYCDILKLNDEEILFLAQRIYGQELTEQQLIERLQKACEIPVVCVTKGAKGCSVYEKGKAPVHVPGKPVAAIDTVGAGDAFGAGFLWGLLQGKDLEQCGKMGNLLGGYVASMRGAIPDYTKEIMVQMRSSCICEVK